MKPKPSELPSDFSLTDDLLAWGLSHGHSHLPERMEWFIDYVKASGKRYHDYRAAFRNSVRSDWAKLNKPKTAAENVVERGKAMGLEPRPGEEMREYQQRVANARH